MSQATSVALPLVTTRAIVIQYGGVVSALHHGGKADIPSDSRLSWPMPSALIALQRRPLPSPAMPV
jgi:hypothetical protein